jgi:uncharacterized coiled-coil DUF342 family protein
MTMKEAVLAALKELVLPELQMLKLEQGELKATLLLTNKRLDDLNLHLADQSRRIDETNKRIDAIHADLIGRIDETNKRIDAIHADLIGRIDETNKRIDAIHADLTGRIDETNRSIARLYEVIVRREDHTDLVARVRILEQEVAQIKQRGVA